MKMKKTLISLLLTTGTILSANNMEVSFYKELVNNEVEIYQSQSFNDYMNINTFFNEKKYNTAAEFVDDCFNRNEKELKACFTLLSKTGYKESLNGLAEFYFNKYQKETDKKTQNIIFSSIFYGIGSGFEGINLTYQQNKSSRLSFGDFLENSNLNVKDLNPLKEYYISGLIMSLDFPLNNMHSQYSGLYNISNFIDISEADSEIINLVDNKKHDIVLTKYREVATNPTTINYIIKTAISKNYNDFYKSLKYGDFELNKDNIISEYALLNQGVNNHDIGALSILSIDKYQKYKLDKKLEPIEREILLNEVLILTALIKEINPDSNQNIIYNVIVDLKNNETKLIETIQVFNNYRKQAILFLDK